jgi:hypothetical protein
VADQRTLLRFFEIDQSRPALIDLTCPLKNGLEIAMAKCNSMRPSAAALLLLLAVFPISALVDCASSCSAECNNLRSDTVREWCET